MPDGPPIRTLIGLAPSDSVAAWEARTGRQTTVRWHEMWEDEHARAFTVAKVARLDVLNMLHASIDEVARNGGTFEQWRERVQPELEKAGWWGRVEDASLTGTDEPVIIGPRRLRTIYETNMRVSRAAGQWARIQRYKDDRPFLRYVTMGDGRVRHQHQLWHGVILPVDDPWWQTHFPPNDWGCRCTVQQWSQRDLDRRGWTVSKVPPPEGPTRTFVRSLPTGARARVSVPAGIGPGWGYNPGQASLRSIADKAVNSIEEAIAVGNVEAAEKTLREIVDSPAFEQFIAAPEASFPIAMLDERWRAQLGATSRLVVLPAGVYRKQQRGHREVPIALYRLIPELVARAVVVIEQGAEKLIFFRGPGQLLKAVVMSDDRDPRPYVVSFHIARPREIDREANKPDSRILLDLRESS